MMNALTTDHIAEAVLIDTSRLQRETVMRWCAVLANAGEHEQAERLRREIADNEARKEMA
jgi:hypothetical protein